MLLDGFNHVAVMTADTERFVQFYRDVLVRRWRGSRGWVTRDS